MPLFRKQPSKADDPELIESLRSFVGAFEVLFHHDWNYAKSMIGDEEEGCTFLKPGLDDETEDWGARGELLEKYRSLKSLMDARGITSDINPNIERALKEYGQWKT
jgi:hypothetical protein